MWINLAHTTVSLDQNGPGRRFTVWVRGCPFACPGCFNPGLRAAEPQTLVEPGELARLALSEAPLDGVTFSGGEPFAQAGPLAAFLDALPPEAKKTVIAFTGFYREELDRGDADQRELLRRVDLLVDGPYREDQPFEEASQAALRGSRNQRLVALTPAGEELKRRVEAAGGGGFGVLIAEDGEVIITGFPPPEALSRLRAALTRGK